MDNIRATKWVALTQLIKVSVQLSGIIILSRLLQPSDFGLMALASVVVNFANLFRDMGTSAAIIQRKTISGALVDTAFYANLMFGGVLGLVVFGFGPFASAMFRDERLAGTLAALAVVFPLAALGVPQLALLERVRKFDLVALIEGSASVIGLCVGVVAAYCGFGVYSLVLQSIATAGLSSAILWLASDWRPSLKWDAQELRKLFKFGGDLVGFNLVNYFARNVDNILIGRFFGSADLGVYSMAYRVLMFPVVNVTFVLNRALLPDFSRRQHELDGVAQTYLAVLSVLATVTAPLMGILWVVRLLFVEVFLGSSWSAAAELLAWFAPTGYIQSMLSTTGTILIAYGHTNSLRNLGIVNSCIVTTAFVIGMKYGMVGMAAAYLVATMIAFGISMRTTLGILNVSFVSFALRVWRQTVCAILMIALMTGLDGVALRGSFGPYSRLALLCCFGAAVYFFLIFVFAGDLVFQLSRLFRTRERRS